VLTQQLSMLEDELLRLLFLLVDGCVFQEDLLIVLHERLVAVGEVGLVSRSHLHLCVGLLDRVGGL